MSGDDFTATIDAMLADRGIDFGDRPELACEAWKTEDLWAKSGMPLDALVSLARHVADMP